MKIVLVCAAAIALSLAACSSNSSSTSTNTAAPEASAMSTGGTLMSNMHAKTMTIVLKELNGSGESGTATLTAMGGRTRVNVGLKGENATGDQPAHIHLGHCPKVNPAPKYPLKSVVLGKSNTIVDVPMSALTGGNMAINVHESTKNLARYVACGDIK